MLTADLLTFLFQTDDANKALKELEGNCRLRSREFDTTLKLIEDPVIEEKRLCTCHQN